MELNGILHIAGERKSRYEFAIELAKILKKEELVIPVSFSEINFKAKRPKDSSLNTEKAKNLKLELPSLKECLEKFVKVYYAYKELEKT